MIIVGVRLPAPVKGAVDYSDLRTHGGDMPDVAVDPDDDACIFYTSGITGRPKGAQLTHRGCVLNYECCFYEFVCSTALARANGTEPIDPANAPITVTLVTTPLFHVTRIIASQPATPPAAKSFTCINGMLARR